MTANLEGVSREFLQLFKAGKAAAKSGNNKKAHDYFRQAIEIDPYREQVWLWLASVVETEEDQRVCFENVLELDPNNLTARRQLQKLEQQRLDEALSHAGGKKRATGSSNKRERRGKWRTRLVLLNLIAIGTAIAVLIILYG